MRNAGEGIAFYLRFNVRGRADEEDIMKKKIFAMMMAAVMTVSMAACGQAADSSADAPADTQESAAPVQESAEDAAAQESTEDAAAQESAQGEDEGAEAERTTLIVGFDAEFPPYGYKDESGEYVGFDLELAEEVCKRNGWELVKQPIDWDSKDMELSAGTIDCIWNGFTMNGREDQYTFTVPYVDNSQVFVVALDSGINTKADLAGKVVGVQKESSALAALEEEENADLLNSFASLNQYADYNTAFMDLEAGAIDALAMDIGVANYNVLQREGGQFNILEGEDGSERLASEQYAIGFLKGNTELKDIVEKTLLEMAEDGTFMQIAEKYSDFGLPESVCLGK